MSCKYSKLEQVEDNRYEEETEESPDQGDQPAEKDEKSVGVKIMVNIRARGY